MDVETRVLREPCLYVRMFVRGVVVADQMQRFPFRRLAVYLAPKGQPFIMAMAPLAMGDDLTIEYAQRSEQSHLCHCVCSHASWFRRGLFQRQARLGTIERLDLTFLVAAQHDRVFGM